LATHPQNPKIPDFFAREGKQYEDDYLYVIQGVGACDGCHMDDVRNHTINDPFNTTLSQTKMASIFALK
jgi:hypothetical protein